MSKGKGKEKEKEKGITIREGAPQTEQVAVLERALQSKKDGKRKVGESVEPPPATQQRTKLGGAVAMLPVFVAEVSAERLVVHSHPLFGLMVPFNKNAPFPSKNSASLLGNPMYNLKLA